MSSLFDQYWFRGYGDATRLGLEPDFAQSLDGDWIALELPPVGEIFGAGETFGFITTDCATHDLRAPCALRILAVNRRAAENPDLARLSPMGEGWLLEVKELENCAIV